jgi:fatty-acid desaturase
MSFRSYFFKVTVIQILLMFAALGHLIVVRDFSFLWYTFGFWFMTHVMGEGIFYHRYFAHNSFECHPLLAKFFTIWAVLGGHGHPIAWRGVHTGLHHAFSDTEKDPHSPIHGKWQSFMFWHLKEWKFPINISKRLIADKFYLWMAQHCIHLWWAVAILVTLFDWRITVYTMGLGGWLGLFWAGITNTFAHIYGYRRFDTKDTSTNIAWLSWFTWHGSILHNNHHAYPNRYHDSYAWYEFDIGKYIIPMIATKVRPLDKLSLENHEIITKK